jgi:hypothetical protein
MPPQPFNGQKKTPNQNFDTSKDNVCPPLRSLNMKNMKDTSALQGQVGSDCKLVHGDRWQQIDGSQTEKINHNLTTDIMVNEFWMVHNDLFYTVNNLTVDNRYGAHYQVNWDVRFDHFIHTRTETHDQREVIHQPTENVNWFQKIVEFSWEKHTSQMFYFVANLFKFEVDGTETSGKGIVIQRIFLRNQNEPTKLTWTGFKSQVGLLNSRIAAARATATVAHAEAEPTANAGPVAEIGAPHI